MKTASERMREYRARMPEACKKNARELNKSQQQAGRIKWDKARKKEEAKKTKIRMRLMRTRNKEAIQSIQSSDKTASPRLVFSSAQALGKAMSRVSKALPLSPRKKTAVVRKLARNFGIEEKAVSQLKNTMPSDTDAKIKDFYMSDIVSRQLPGKRDYVTVLTEKGTKERVQKKVLMMTVREAYEVFKKEHNDIKIGKSKFASLRPKNVVPVSDSDQTVCCCRYHENLDLLLDGLKRSFHEIPNGKQLVEQASCKWDKMCYFGECPVCSNVQVVVDRVLDKDQLVVSSGRAMEEGGKVSYYQWTAANNKELVTGTVPEIKSELNSQLTSVKKHSFLAKVQLQQIKELKLKLKEDEAIIQEDFSENFSIKQQDEIMSAHWMNESVTLFTAVIYQNSTSTSYVVISDEVHHDKYAVFCFNQVILRNYISDRGNTVQQLHVFSDGAASQFKNRYTLSNILKPQMVHDTIQHIDWSFFATAHGKGPIDGVGGTVKRAVWHRILQKRVVINSARDFAEVAKESCPNINIIYVESQDVSASKSMLEKAWNDNPPRAIPHTHSMHYARSYSSCVIEVSDISPFLETQQPEFRQACIFSNVELGEPSVMVETAPESDDVHANENTEDTANELKGK